MSSLKTFLILLLALPGTGFAKVDPLSTTFAYCAGRFSAELEHAWLMRDPDADRIHYNRRQFLELLDATAPVDQHNRLLALRVDAKVAHAALLSTAVFSGNSDRAHWAAARAQSEISICLGFLLDS